MAAAYIITYGSVTIANSTISSERRQPGVAAYLTTRTAALTITNSTISGNIANAGGGIFNNHAVLGYC